MVLFWLNVVVLLMCVVSGAIGGIVAVAVMRGQDGRRREHKDAD